MIVYRITGSKYSNDISGTGAAIYGGRWNKKGTPILYTGESKEIALLETVVHVPPGLAPKLDILEIKIPDSSIEELHVKDLPANWSDYPAPTILSEIAGQWVSRNETIALCVPSCIIHTSKNYLLNCLHPNYSRLVEVVDKRPFHFDPRLKRQK